MKRLALLIDGENISSDHFDAIAAHCHPLGETRVALVFADFGEGRCKDWIATARRRGLQPIFQLSAGKNSTDIAMTVAAMDILHAGAIDTIALASSDRDFIPLVQRLRLGGVSVVLFTQQPPHELMQRACDKIVHLGRVPVARPAPKIVPAPKPPAIKPISAEERAFLIDLVEDLCHGAGGKPIGANTIGVELRRRNLPLAERIGGSGLLKRLVANKIVVQPQDGPNKMVSAAKRLA